MEDNSMAPTDADFQVETAEELAFIEPIWQHPLDDGPRLAYADWLDERGDPRGELIRLQCQWPSWYQSGPRGLVRRERMEALIRDHGRRWVDPEGLPWGVRISYERGMPLASC